MNMHKTKETLPEIDRRFSDSTLNPSGQTTEKCPYTN